MGVCTSNNKRKNIIEITTNSTFSSIHDNNSVSSINIIPNMKNWQEENKKINEKKKVESINEIALRKHNEYRKKYGSNPLKLNDDLCELAQKYAEICAEAESLDQFPCLFNGNIIGENIKEFECINIDITTLFKEWLKENDDKQGKQKKFNASHFSQLLWKDSK